MATLLIIKISSNGRLIIYLLQSVTYAGQQEVSNACPAATSKCDVEWKPAIIKRCQVTSCKKPGTLPECADLSKAARTLLMRLLETDPRHRMRSLRTLQQSAFYMNFNFEHIKSKKITPKHVLEQNTPFLLAEDNKNKFIGFDQP
ncbi:hypothetical protein KGM_207823 [Danaus plexippus plexippus]|uniref:Uncharacterized protein n=1 Tax=Danaus plexippus plexippus TaxID=278856 RepID=A0A212FLD8_DANPL|nr:hypothetical protein KGM_207823 [Danaus plexippus plexippus]